VAHLDGPDGACRELVGSVVTVGRDRSNDIVLDADRKVSRRHAEIRIGDGQWRLVDLNSRNGTYVNDRPARDHPLVDGDRLRFGDSTFTFVSTEDPNATELGLPEPDAAADRLSERERSVVSLVAEGLTDKDIAARLFISPSTVRSHLDRIADKTGLRRRSELTRLALEQRFVDRSR
jgi:pSer/pThr/pTyr-binding forkhead associated (FHA) protein